MEYIGEQPLWGIVGHCSVVLAFVTALFSAIVNFLRTRDKLGEDNWRKPARIIYYTHFIAVASIFFTLLLMIWNHRFEYQYVWQHSKRDMAMNYILACLWEGQEGSTLLWLLWHAVIGLILIRTAREWEAPVITVVSLVQVFLAMMLLGWYFGDVHVGSSPFTLIREREENIGLPWTFKADYLTTIPAFADGRGLNPLLQNYWMTIHPPTLFLGFALVTVPFAFALSALWLKRWNDWQRPALPWAFTGVGILGIGILMGGAWAYESLSFGGFWAWDPVENASLVPWLTLVGAAHVMLIYRIKGQSLFTTLFLSIISFLLIVYSTFLTKSGVLSETSVHAFTEDGLNHELVWFMSFFLWLSVLLFLPNRISRMIYSGAAVMFGVLFAMNMIAPAMLVFLIISLAGLIYGYRKQFKQPGEEEELWSREFWMFIGSLLLTFVAVIVIVYTSSPVINRFLRIGPVHDMFHWLYDLAPGNGMLKQLAEAKMAPGNDVVDFYNRWTIPFTVLIVLLVAVTQYFKYKKDEFGVFAKKIRRSFFISAAISLPLMVFLYFNADWSEPGFDRGYMSIMNALLLFASVFAVLSNSDYWYKILKGRIKSAGASIAHIGFGLLLLGALISTSKKDTISQNTSDIDVRSIDQSGDNAANIFLRRGDVMPMGDYMVRYTGREYKLVDGTPYVYFNVDYMKKDAAGQLENAFTLRPFIQLNERMGNAAEPDTRHYLHKDIYTFIKFVPMTSLQPPGKDENSDYSTPKNHTVVPGDTIAADNSIAVLDSIYSVRNNSELNLAQSEVAIAARFRVTGRSNAEGDLKTTTLTGYFVADTATGRTRQIDARDNDLGLKLTFYKVNPQNGRIDVYASEQNNVKRDFIVMEATIFPAINILWIGCLVMFFGTMLAVRERWKTLRKKPADTLPENQA
ncbi:MAG: cytochrome c biogenesis protein CcsA [Bacteroidetes bacterium]|nr:cytochrome c biogenesis protein CcsA [Bacteroidota bacterium]